MSATKRGRVQLLRRDGGDGTQQTVKTTWQGENTDPGNGGVKIAETTYTYNRQGRLWIAQVDADADGKPESISEYTYDFGNRWVRKVVSPGTANEEKSIFIHDGADVSPLPQAGEGSGVRAPQIALEFSATGTGDLLSDDLTHRYLWGPTVDQILADEAVSSLATEGDVLWPLTDHLNTVRDLAQYDEATDTTTIANHIVYDAYGNITSETAPTVACLFGFTARPFDAATGLQNNLNRWYDGSVGRWLSEDPIGFQALDFNLYRYCGNVPISTTDPSGELVRFANRGDAEEFVKEVGLHNAEIVQGTGYFMVVAPPSERAKVFAYADKRFSQVFTLNSSDNKWEEVASRRNLFIQASGVIPHLGYAAVDVHGNGTGFTFPDLAKIKEILSKWAESEQLVIDIGGEGRYPDAINVNIQPKTSTTGKPGRNIPLDNV